MKVIAFRYFIQGARMNVFVKICAILAFNIYVAMAATNAEELFFTQIQAIKEKMPNIVKKYLNDEREKLEKDHKQKKQKTYSDAIDVDRIDEGEVLLRKYSGHIGNREIHFFVQIYKHKIVSGVIALPNEPMIPFSMTKDKKVKIGFFAPYLDINMSLGLGEDLALQVSVSNQKIATLSPVCPSIHLCSYVKSYIDDNEDELMRSYFLYFPDMQIVVMGKNEDSAPIKTAHSYKEAMDLAIANDKNKKWYEKSSTSLLFINDTYMSFYESASTFYTRAGGSFSYFSDSGFLFDIKTQSILRDSIQMPKSLANKYTSAGDSVFNESVMDDEIEKPEYYSESLDIVTSFYQPYFDGFYYFRAWGQSDINTMMGMSSKYDEWGFVAVPINEVKPYLNPGVYNYLIGKTTAPPKSLISKE